MAVARAQHSILGRPGDQATLNGLDQDTVATWGFGNNGGKTTTSNPASVPSETESPQRVAQQGSIPQLTLKYFTDSWRERADSATQLLKGLALEVGYGAADLVGRFGGTPPPTQAMQEERNPDFWTHPSARFLSTDGLVLFGALIGSRVGGEQSLGGAREPTGFSGRTGFELKNLQTVRNQPATINEIPYSGHALDQMQNRGITPSVVENTIRTGRGFTDRVGTRGYYDAVNRITVIRNSETGQIVTVRHGEPQLVK